MLANDVRTPSPSVSPALLRRARGRLATARDLCPEAVAALEEIARGAEPVARTLARAALASLAAPKGGAPAATIDERAS